MYDKEMLEVKKKVDKLLAHKTPQYKQGYNEAIDDFVEQLRVHYALYQEQGHVVDTLDNIIRNLFEYAEMMKR